MPFLANFRTPAMSCKCKRCVTCYFPTPGAARRFARKQFLKPPQERESGPPAVALFQPRHPPNALWLARWTARQDRERRKAALNRADKLLAKLDDGGRGRKRRRDSRDSSRRRDSSRDPSIPPSERWREHARARTLSPPPRPAGPSIVIFASSEPIAHEPLVFIKELPYGGEAALRAEREAEQARLYEEAVALEKAREKAEEDLANLLKWHESRTILTGSKSTKS